MGELGMEAELREEIVEERRTEFLALNPAGHLPVLLEHDGQVVPGAGIIAEYLDETRGLVLGDRRLLPEDPSGRVEVRRLVHWFGEKFHAEVSGALVHEKIMKRLLPAELGGGSPDPSILRAAQLNIRYHLDYIGHLIQRRNWLAGDRLSYADLAAAAHLSAIDYLGDVPWEANETARQWYARMKSRPAFRTILADRLRGILPAAHYANPDF
jgi:glutathione S-transferase